MPSLLDLLPLPAPQAARSGTAFDALLQPPPRCPPPENSRPPAAGDPPRHSAPDAQPSHHAQDPHRPPSVTPERRPDESADSGPDPSAASPPTADDPPSDEEPFTDWEVVAQSLAGIAISVLPVPAAADTPAGTAEAPPLEPALSKGKSGPRSARPGSKGAVQVSNHAAVTNLTAPAAAGNNDQAAEAERLRIDQVANEALQQPLAVQATHEHGAALADSVQATGGSELPTPEAVIAAAALPAEIRDDESAQFQGDSTPNDSQQPVDVTIPEFIPAPDTPTPVVGPVTVPLPAAGNPVAPADASSGTNAIGLAGGARRSRLPTEAAAPESVRAARNAPANIDASRLLSRVARAFALAQERDGDIQLRLSPPELGSLKLTVQQQEGGLVARLETETESAKTALIENLPALRERLAEQGLRIERFDIDLMQRQPGGTPDRPGDQHRDAPPAPRREEPVRTLAPVASPRGPLTAGSSATGLNVIV
jgi:flagellar hook-length control protein FliK